MPRKQNSSDRKEQGSGDFGFKQMILKVDTDKHSWIKTIAEETGMTQPNVVNLILGEATKHEPTAYIDQIKKLNAKEALKDLEEKARTIESERKRLTDMLKA